jgi:hypothetical protein
MVNYRRAEQLAPRDPDIRANLGFARNTVPAGITLRRPFWQRRLPRLTLNEWVVAVMVPGWAWFALLALGQARPALRPVLRRYVVLAASATALGGVGLWLGWRLQFQTQTAVVVVKEAVLRHGPLDESPSLQTLRDGQELRVVDSKDGWLQLAGANRGVGWLKQDQVIVLGGP